MSGWRLRTLARFAADAITAFGTMPLKIWSYIGLMLAIPSIAFGLYIALRTLVFGNDVPGYPSLIVAICFFSGVQLIGMGIMGEYISRIMSEVKQRPIYLVQERIGFDDVKDLDTGHQHKIAS